MLLTTFTYTYEASSVHEQKVHAYCIVGRVNGRGYDGQLKYTIYDTCRPCHSILSILKPVFSKFDIFIVLKTRSGA